jgi:hypothetical protein
MSSLSVQLNKPNSKSRIPVLIRNKPKNFVPKRKIDYSVARTDEEWDALIGPDTPAGKAYWAGVSKRKKDRLTSTIGGFATSLERTFLQIVKDPVVVLAFLAAIAIAVSYNSNPASSIVHSLVDSLNKYEMSKPLGNWISTNIKKFVGFVIFLPSLFSVQGDYRVYLSAAIAVWVFFVDEISIWQYVLQCGLVLLYFRKELVNYRIIIILLGVFVWYSGHLIPQAATVASSTHRPTGK